MRRAVYCLCLIVQVSAMAVAADDAGQRQELRELQEQIQDVGADVKLLEASKNAQLEQLKKLEKQYGELANSLATLKAEIKQQERDLQDVRERISLTQKSILAQKTSLEGLIKSAYIAGDKDGLKVMMSQRDPSISGRMLVYYEYISKARVKKLKAIEQTVDELRQLEAQKDTEAQLLQASLEKKQQETDALDALKDERQKLLAKISQDFTAKSGQLDKLLNSEKRLQTVIDNLQNESHEPAVAEPQIRESVMPSPKANVEPEVDKQPVLPKKALEREELHSLPVRPFAELKGQLPWPVAGGISERFGTPRFETTWDGVVINAREGADVHAVSAGRVAYADWLRGYGLLVIVDHGKGYMSLYAFNQSLHKNIGEYVKAGESVASVGRSGGRAQAALYFGIRHQGRAVDPEKWCRKLGKG